MALICMQRNSLDDGFPMYNEGRENCGKSGLLYGHISLCDTFYFAVKRNYVTGSLGWNFFLHLSAVASAY